MGKQISPAVAIVAILVVVIVVAAIGYFAVSKKKAVSDDDGVIDPMEMDEENMKQLNASGNELEQPGG